MIEAIQGPVQQQNLRTMGAQQKHNTSTPPKIIDSHSFSVATAAVAPDQLSMNHPAGDPLVLLTMKYATKMVGALFFLGWLTNCNVQFVGALFFFASLDHVPVVFQLGSVPFPNSRDLDEPPSLIPSGPSQRQTSSCGICLKAMRHGRLSRGSRMLKLSHLQLYEQIRAPMFDMFPYLLFDHMLMLP